MSASPGKRGVEAAMQSSGHATFSKQIQQVADEYKQRGYRVTIEPAKSQLPEFLRAYQPALVAEGPDDSVVVEFRSRAAEPRSNGWGDLAKTLQQHPGWRLELVIDDKPRNEPPTTLTPSEIESRLQDGLRLLEANMFPASLLVTWSATEAAMRLAAKKHRVELPDFRPATLITRLYTDGLMDREDYDQLMDYMRLRNTVAHGFREDALDASSVEQLSGLALRILHES